MAFTCEACYLQSAQPYCTGCNKFLTDDVKVAESVMNAPKCPTEALKWLTAFGHWGDVFCCCGMMKEFLRQTGQERVNVLYVGPDMAIPAWLREQEFVESVIALNSGKEGYEKFWGATTNPGGSVKSWLPILWDADSPLPQKDDFTQTHINYAWWETVGGMPAQVWHGGKLPVEAHIAMDELLQEVLPIRGGKVYHIHPVSTWSELAGNHWTHWLAAMEWLVEKTPHTYLLTGLEKMEFLPKSPRLINLIGKTATNMEVLALSDFCDGVISTPNSIALWSVIKGQKCLCVGNKATQFISSYYRRFLEKGERLTYCNVDTPLSRFQATACEFLDE
jgi:hypothetical protein